MRGALGDPKASLTSVSVYPAPSEEEVEDLEDARRERFSASLGLDSEPEELFRVAMADLSSLGRRSAPLR